MRVGQSWRSGLYRGLRNPDDLGSYTQLKKQALIDSAPIKYQLHLMMALLMDYVI